MQLASFLEHDGPNRVVVQGELKQRQTVYNLQQSIVGEHNLFEVLRDMKAAGCSIRVTIDVLSREAQLGS